MLALGLGGRTIAELRRDMDEPEWLRWEEFYRQNPFDFHHLIYRPAALLASRMSGVSVQDELDFLERRPDPMSNFSAADRAMFKAAGVSPPRRP